METEEQASFSKVVLIVGAIAAFHLAAFAYWVYKYATSSDKRVMEFKSNVD
jgi:hypothetical protein